MDDGFGDLSGTADGVPLTIRVELAVPVNACRKSKSDDPRSLGPAPAQTRNASLESLSMECDHVYDASACTPRARLRRYCSAKAS